MPVVMCQCRIELTNSEIEALTFLLNLHFIKKMHPSILTTAQYKPIFSLRLPFSNEICLCVCLLGRSEM